MSNVAYCWTLFIVLLLWAVVLRRRRLKRAPRARHDYPHAVTQADVEQAHEQAASLSIIRGGAQGTQVDERQRARAALHEWLAELGRSVGRVQEGRDDGHPRALARLRQRLSNLTASVGRVPGTRTQQWMPAWLRGRRTSR